MAVFPRSRQKSCPSKHCLGGCRRHPMAMHSSPEIGLALVAGAGTVKWRSCLEYLTILSAYITDVRSTAADPCWGMYVVRR